jgi:hypothetical protein
MPAKKTASRKRKTGETTKDASQVEAFPVEISQASTAYQLALA